MEVTFPRMQQSVYPHSREWTVDFGYNAPESLDRMKGSRLASLPLFRASLSKGSNQQRVRPRLTTRCLTVVANATKTLPLFSQARGFLLDGLSQPPLQFGGVLASPITVSKRKSATTSVPWAVAVPPPSTLPTTASQSPSHHSHLALTSSRKGQAR